MTEPAGQWVRKIRAMVLLESQVLASLRSHRNAAAEDRRVRYAFTVSLSERRLRILAEALERRGACAPGTRMASALGGAVGKVTSWGGRRRVLAADIAGIERLQRFYFAGYEAAPPEDVKALLAGFLGELGAAHCALLSEFREVS